MRGWVASICMVGGARGDGEDGDVEEGRKARDDVDDKVDVEKGGSDERGLCSSPVGDPVEEPCVEGREDNEGEGR